MHPKRVPPSLTEVKNYRAYQVALETLYMKTTGEFNQPVEQNPFNKADNPDAHKLYDAILKNGALKIYDYYHLNENTVEQHIIDDIIYTDKTKNLKNFHQNAVMGSDKHLDYILQYQQANPGQSFVQASLAYLITKNDVLIKDQLDYIAPMINRWAVDNSDEYEKRVQDTAVVIDIRLGFKLPDYHDPHKNTGRNMKLSMPVRHKKSDDGKTLIRNFAKKLGL